MSGFSERLQAGGFRRQAIATCLFICAALIISCNKGGDAEEKAVRKAVRAYDDALAKTYYELSVEPLATVASPEEQKRNEVFIEKLTYEKTRMRANIKEFKFESVVIESDERAIAITSEKWEVEKVSIDGSVVVSPRETIEYRLEYRLTRKPGGSWVVDRKRSLDSL